MLSRVLRSLPDLDDVAADAKIDHTISAYVRGQSGVCLILGLYYVVGLSLVGLRYGLLIGVVAGLLNIISAVDAHSLANGRKPS